MLLAHLADTHLGRTLYGLSWVSDEILEHFKEAMDVVMRDHVDAVLVAGDMFDVWRPPNRVIREVIGVVRSLTDRGIRVYATLGEHDTPKRRDIPVHLLIPGLKLLGHSETALKDCFNLGGREYCVAGVRNHRLTYGERVKGKLLERIRMAVSGLDNSAVKVLMLHQNISNFFAFEPGLDVNELPDTPAYVAMGHLHRRIIHRREGTGQVIAYPGSLDILDKGEISTYKAEGKGFYIVDLSGDEPSVSKVDTPAVLNIDKVEAVLEDMRARIEAKAAELAAKGERAILVAEVVIGVDDKPKADEIVRALRQRLRGRDVYLKVDYKLAEVAEISPGIEEIDTGALEVSAIKSLIKERLGQEPSDELVKSIIVLKEAAIAGNQDDLLEALKDIASHSIWDRIVPDIFKTSPPTRRGGGGRDLTSFFRRGS